MLTGGTPCQTPAVGPGARSVSAVDQLGVAASVDVGFGLRQRGLAQQVDRVGDVVPSQVVEAVDGAFRRLTGDEAVRHRVDALAHDARYHRPERRRRSELGAGLDDGGRVVAEVLADVVGDGGGAAQGRQDVDEAQELDAKVGVAGRPTPAGAPATSAG